VRGAWAISHRVVACRLSCARWKRAEGTQHTGRPHRQRAHGGLDWRIWERAGPRAPESEFSSMALHGEPRAAGAPDSLKAF
jgi:hypothetical protein